MGLIRVIFELFLLYLLYKLIFDLIIPVYQAGKQVRQKMEETQSRMNEHMKQQQTGSNSSPVQETRPAREDYIEFEEIK